MKKKKKQDDAPRLFDDKPQDGVRADFPLARPHARNTDPETSHIWAKYLDVDGNAKKGILCLYHHDKDGLNAYDCADITKVCIANMSRIFTTLWRDEIVERLGKKDNRRISKLTAKGREIALRLVGDKES